jgi:hypothetical protein
MDTGILSLESEGINLINFILNELKNINARFDQVLGVIANDRVHFDDKWAEFKAYSDEKWDANDARWDANDARWDANDLKWIANDARWDANDLKWIANDARWDANDLKWIANDARWDANDARWDANDLKWIANDARWDANDLKWIANDARWDANDLKWIANDARWDANDARWDANDLKWIANDARWDANDLKWIANDARWDANDARWVADILKWQFNDIHWLNTDSILDGLISSFLDFKKDNLKFEEFMRVKIGALGARWGVATENSYRSMLESILVKSFDVEVQNYIGFDETGTVFGRPDQVELDVIIKNGILIIIELKSSVSKNDLYIFERKVRWYELKFSLKAERAIVVSPMVDRWAISVAEKLHVELFSNFEDLHLEFRKQMKA